MVTNRLTYLRWSCMDDHDPLWAPWNLNRFTLCQWGLLFGYTAQFCPYSPGFLQWHDDVIKWKYFPPYWPFVWGIHMSPVNFLHKGQWRRALVFSMICAWTNSCANHRDADDLRCHGAHYDVTVMYRFALWQRGFVAWLYRSILSIFARISSVALAQSNICPIFLTTRYKDHINSLTAHNIAKTRLNEQPYNVHII